MFEKHTGAPGGHLCGGDLLPETLQPGKEAASAKPLMDIHPRVRPGSPTDGRAVRCSFLSEPIKLWMNPKGPQQEMG